MRLHVRYWFQPTTFFQQHIRFAAYTLTNKKQWRDLYHQQNLADSLLTPFCRGAVSPVIKSTSPAWKTGSSTTKKSPPREFCERSQEPCEARRSAWKLGWPKGDHESQDTIYRTHLINFSQSHYFYWLGMFGSAVTLSIYMLPLAMSTWNGPRNSREV